MNEDSLDILHRKEFKGFTEAPSIGEKEVSDYLGIPDPMIRTFYYKGYPKYSSLHQAWAKIQGNRDPFIEFVKDKRHRAHYDEKEEAIFMREEDRFAEVHEVGHAIIHRINPDLKRFYLEGWKERQATGDRVAGYALDEGAAQYISIATGLKSQIPERIAEAIRENNKLVDGEENNTSGYNPTLVRSKIDSVKSHIATYVQSPVVKRRMVAYQVSNMYEKLLDDVYKDAMAIGYVYTAVQVAELLMKQDNTINTALKAILKNPPSLTDLVDKVSACEELPAL